MKVLIAYDGSECANRALDDLLKAGLPDDTHVCVLSVIEHWLPPPSSLEVVTHLDSKTARPGDLFRARVRVPVVDERSQTLVPAGSLIEGRVESVERAKYRRRSGIIEVSFSQLLIGNERYPLNAALAPNVEDDRLRVDEEGNLRGETSSKKRTVAFIGGGAGAGALIGAFTAGAILGAGVGAGVGVLATFLAKGKEATVAPGTEIGIELKPEILPFSSIPAWLPPFWMSPGQAMKRG